MTPARVGSPSAARIAAGSELARASTSRAALWLGSCRTASRQSSMKRSRLNIVGPPLLFSDLNLRRRLGAVTLLVEVVGAVKLEDEVAVDGRLVARRVAGRDAARHAF